MNQSKGILLLFLFGISTLGYSQDSLTLENKKWSLNGYVKDMVTFNNVEKDSTLIDNLIHNRLNLEVYPSENITFYVGVRNRIFHGDLVRFINTSPANFLPSYGEFIDTNNDYFNLSKIWVDEPDWVMHSVIDRMYVEWIINDWEIRIGRQRINWGTNIVWNPNDLFNAYSFFDFDYEERPGTDAIRVTKYFGFASSAEIAIKMADRWDESVMALMYKFNRGMYDIQLIGGIAQGDLTAGVGWAGNLGNAGFKGEITHFEPLKDDLTSVRATAGALSIDYSFPNSTYLLGSYLFSSLGDREVGQEGLSLVSNQQLSAKNLMPFKHSMIIQVSHPIHPLVNVGLSTMAFPGDNAIFINPSVGLSIKSNLDLGLFGQVFYNDDAFGNYGASAKLFFARLKWSF